MRHSDDDHFRKFAQNLEACISKYGNVPRSEMVAIQKKQVEKLVALEKEFRQTLIRHPWGPSVYRNFVTFICDEKRNILAARPFFRERQGVFTNSISKALKKRQDKALYKFDFNYEFVQFTLSQKRWAANRNGSRIVALANEIRDLRWELVEMNMPLAIDRARMFFRRTPQSHLAYMDLVQITAMGLMAGIDKFCLPYGAAFRHTVIGRMIGNLIEEYSETLIHFYPGEKRKVYRANKIISRMGDTIDWEAVVAFVNRDLEPQHRTTIPEIQDLLSASSTVSSDVPVASQEDEEETTTLDVFQAPEDYQPDVQVEHSEAMKAVGEAIQMLPLIEQKLLRMKGVAI